MAVVPRVMAVEPAVNRRDPLKNDGNTAIFRRLPRLIQPGTGCNRREIMFKLK